MSDRVLVLARVVLLLIAVTLLLYAVTRILGVGIVPGYTPQRVIMVTVSLVLLAFAAGLHKDGWSVRFLRWYRTQFQTHRRVRWATVTGWLLLWLVGPVVGAELLVSRLAAIPSFLNSPSLQPYLMHGDFYGGVSEEAMRLSEGPEAYGYNQLGSVHIYQFDREISSIADRGDFLFQDRAAMANDTSNSETLRVFALGASVVHGQGASSTEKRWYVALEQTLSSALGREVHVIPAAMPGYVSTQERIALDLMVLPRCPDAVIMLDGFNDAYAPANGGIRPGDPFSQVVLYEESRSLSFGIMKWLGQHSTLVRIIHWKSVGDPIAKNTRRISGDPQLTAKYIKSTASVYMDNLQSMLDECAARDTPCAAFLQPMKVLTERSLGVDRQLDPIDFLVLGTYDEILKRIRNLPASAPVHELTTVFDAGDAQAWYVDNVHPTDAGQQALAAAIHPIVLDLLQQRIASGPGKERCQRAAR